MTIQHQITALAMMHARAVAELDSINAQANNQSAREGWTCDWSIGMNQKSAELLSYEQQYQALIIQMEDSK